MLSYIKYLLILLFPISSAWADLTIFDVRKNLPMSDSDPVFRDFIINGGNEAGLSVGMIVTVQRRTPLYDTYQNRSAGDLQLKVAKVKIIHVQKGLAVARLHSEFTREGTPILEENYIMVGDSIDLSSASSDKKADGGKSEGSSAAMMPDSQPIASNSKPNGQILVNSVELSSHASKDPSNQPLPQKVDVPVLQ